LRDLPHQASSRGNDFAAACYRRGVASTKNAAALGNAGRSVSIPAKRQHGSCGMVSHDGERRIAGLRFVWHALDMPLSSARRE